MFLGIASLYVCNYRPYRVCRRTASAVEYADCVLPYRAAIRPIKIFLKLKKNERYLSGAERCWESCKSVVLYKYNIMFGSLVCEVGDW